MEYAYYVSLIIAGIGMIIALLSYLGDKKAKHSH